MAEKRLIIYADDLIKCLKKHDRRIPGIPWSITGIQNILKELKPVDAVEVVRCKDCTSWKKSAIDCGWCEAWEGMRYHNNYCNYGERKDKRMSYKGGHTNEQSR